MLGDAASSVTEEDAARTRRCKRKSGAFTDRPSFFGGDRRHNLDREPIGCRHIDDEELNPGVLQASQKIGVSRQPIEASNDQSGSMNSAEGKCAIKLGTIASPTTLDLGHLLQDAPPISDEAPNRLALSFQAEPADPLLLRAYPEINNCAASDS